jgi:hypothetical protein
LNGVALPAGAVISVERSVISVRVSKSFTQDAGKLAVAVRNPEGAVSDPAAIDVRAPHIVSFSKNPILAGETQARVDINGEDFRPGAGVYVGNGGDINVKLNRRHVRFRTDARITITLNVVNPNNGDGVSSDKAALNVVGPTIANVEAAPVADTKQVRLIITGANFRGGALVEFVKGDAVVRQATPERLRADRATLTVRARFLEALGSYTLRVVNPGPVPSAPYRPTGGDALAAGDND